MFVTQVVVRPCKNTCALHRCTLLLFHASDATRSFKPHSLLRGRFNATQDTTVVLTRLRKAYSTVGCFDPPLQTGLQRWFNTISFGAAMPGVPKQTKYPRQRYLRSGSRYSSARRQDCSGNHAQGPNKLRPSRKRNFVASPLPPTPLGSRPGVVTMMIYPPSPKCSWLRSLLCGGE